MAKGWHVQGFESASEIFDGWASGHLSERQITQLLARLHCRHLTDAEIIAATVNSDGRNRVSEMVVPMNDGKRLGYMTTGNPHYVAVYEDRNV